MSWIKKRVPSTPSPAPVPPVQMYNPNQHSTQENQWYNPQHQDNWYNQQPQQYVPAAKQDLAPVQPMYRQPAYQPTPGYNQNVSPQQFGQPQQPQQQQQFQNQQQATSTSVYYQSNPNYQRPQTYGNVQYNQQYNQNNLYTPQSQHQAEGDSWNWSWGDEDNSNVQVKLQQHEDSSIPQAANNIGEAFATDESWNWGVDDAKPTQETGRIEEVVDSQGVMGQLPKLTTHAENNSSLNQHPATQDSSTLASKRGKLETPQWSTESQMSQESSDDVLHTSESDKSHKLLSSVNHSLILEQEHGTSNYIPDRNSLQPESVQFENKEIIPLAQPELPLEANPTPPIPKVSQTPPLNMLPPAGIADDTRNPYKRSTGLLDKSSNKFRSSTITPESKRQNFAYQPVNLETLPDNSEQPDPVPAQPFQKLKATQRPENNEAPINDRNQYLETGHLSEVGANDYGLNDSILRQEVGDTLPPPGLRRMIPGQIEQNENASNIYSFTDEPPPGLSRMVLGQTETVSSSQLGASSQNDDLRAHYDPSGPPEGLHRMIPGESSSPESNLRQVQQIQDDNDSEVEFNQLMQHTPQPRSATIGADTPPTVSIPPINQAPLNGNRSETIGANTTQDTSRTRGVTVTLNNNKKNGNESDNRRDSIEGETQENEIIKLANSVRNLTVGENLTDGQASNTSHTEPVARRHSRKESSDSDGDIKSMPRGQRDRRSAERAKRDREKNRERDHYSPDNYREKKYDRRKHKDRRYEEDTDYYSDKERERRPRDDRDREYDRKYSSLRKDKDKERRRRDTRDYRRNDYYYSSRYEEDYNNEARSSRPSSRSDSMHESYRERGHEKDHRDRKLRDRERDRYRRQRDVRDMYNPYQGFSSYDSYNPYYQQYQYYENLRRTNPQAYAEWYRKYYQQATTQASYGSEDRASVHSGRSSANDELTKDRYTRQSFYSQASTPHMGSYYGDIHSHSVTGPYGLDTSSFSRPYDQTDSSLNLNEINLAANRLTPAKFSTAHLKASISSGKLLRILPHYPMDGQNATVEICQLQSLLSNDKEYIELNEFPGPLVKGITHKKTIIEYCENKIKNAAFNQDLLDVESYILMWELLILLIRQNGMVVGTDIAELLLKNRRDAPPRPSSVLSSISSNVGDGNTTHESINNHVSENMGSIQSVLKEEEVTNKFREYLLYGSGKEALEWAMKHGLWGHALFLASKLDKRTYANVMMRFANGLTLNDPLQTLYQLLSGKMPAAVTCVADEKWGDWHPHLSMILSNSTQHPELNRKAIMTLGDTLRQRGSLFAAQFCYLLAEVGFGKHDNPDTRLVLLGVDHSTPFPSFASNEAIHMTEIYEFACGLNDPNFVLPHFQLYKYLLATRLADRGLLEKSLNYLERISTVIVTYPSSVEKSFIDNVCNLANRLKYCDPVGDEEDESQFGGILETSRPDHSWLKELRAVQNDFQSGLITHQSTANLQNYPLECDLTQNVIEPNGQDAWQQHYDQQYQQNVWQPQQLQLEQQQPPVQIENQDNQLSQPNDYSQLQYQNQQSYWPNQQPLQTSGQVNQSNDESVNQQQSYYGSNTQSELSEVQKDASEETPLSQITLPNQSGGNMYEAKTEKDEESTNTKKPSPVRPKPQSPKQEKTQSTGWFGGIFSKLALKPKNQMKLPDDKNPKIVWDQDKKRWVNVDEDPNDPSNEFKPPPKLSDLMLKNASVSANTGHQTISQSSSLPTMNPLAESAQNNGNQKKSSLQSNMFKMQRNRNLKNSYIDVFNPGGKVAAPTSLPAPDNFGTTSTHQMNFFIPQPVSDANAPVDFLTAGGVPHMGEQQMSRWSSTSSLSREVQYYMQQNQKSHLR